MVRAYPIVTSTHTKREIEFIFLSVSDNPYYLSWSQPISQSPGEQWNYLPTESRQSKALSQSERSVYYPHTRNDTPNKSGKPIQCEECGKTFTQLVSKRIHMQSIHQNITHSCVCGKVYRYQRGLRRHLAEGCAAAQQNIA